MTSSEPAALSTPAGSFAHAVRQHGWWLIAAFVFAMPLGKGFEVPLALMTFGGIALMFKDGRAIWRHPSIRWLLLLFVCIWLPLVTALPDAVYFERAASTALAFVRFPLAGVFALYALRDEANRRKLFIAITLLLSFWVADALLQAAIGHDVFGYKSAGGRITGPFAKLTMGLIVAVLAPVYFEVIRRRAARSSGWYWLALAPYTAVILLSGSRAAWGMYAAGMVGFAVYAHFTAPRRHLGRAILIVLLCAASIGALIATYPPLQNKLRVTAGLFSGNYEKMDEATSIRLPIWHTAIKIAKDHWLNGIGARGFRYIYPQYADPDDPFMKVNPTSGPTHPHQITLEILVETGVIGLLGFVAFLVLLLRRTWQAMRAGNTYAVPLGLSVLVATLPVNAGIAFYGSILSALVWWLVASYCATLANEPENG
ncbi:membrane protein [Sulfuriferula plumbiphila]|uniref:Membrane protein n=1 Tax=Sulfuriferula plumbiphila TaxID=171865 RepID=A0A512L9L8_9PROT|nr:O-antigen ligase family protein [Sulfuriferula plumbiphila]BBP03675.1 membrane protein [Sulfuriferula plumbiphila]GEP31185.1 membrane protein [Sulfuriferula plumbiphila]